MINAYLLWAPASLIGAGVTGSHHNHLLETGVALVRDSLIIYVPKVQATPQ